MAEQNVSPPPWHPSMSDGGTMIMDKLPLSGDATKDFIAHDKDYHFGGGLWKKIKSDARLVKGLWSHGLSWKLLSPIVFLGVSFGGLLSWNWKGPGFE